MINPDILKRLAKGTDDDRPSISCIHIKDTYAEVTDGRILVREIISDEKQKEACLEPKAFQVIEVDYPDTEKLLRANKDKATLYKIALSPKVLKKFLSVMPRHTAEMTFEIKGADAPVYVTCEGMEGMIMPMALEEVTKPVSGERPAISKVTISFGDGKEETITTKAFEKPEAEKKDEVLVPA